MPNEGAPHEVREETPPRTPACLAILPNELLFCIIRFSIAVGREVDASALARTNSKMYESLKPELYKIVIKHRTFHILHWATRRNQTATLRMALAYGADPNEMWTDSSISEPRPSPFRPLGWGLNTAQKLDRAVRSQLAALLWSGPRPQPQAPVNWMSASFSSLSLPLPNAAHLLSLWHHYSAVARVDETDCETDDGKDDTRLDEISAPLDDAFTFPENISSTDMDGRTVKISVMRIFRQFNHPLHLAALYDRTEVTAALLLHGADVDSICVQVCFCSKHKKPSSVPYSPTSNHLVTYTPLHVAICSRNYKTAKFLVTHGARRMAKVFSGNDDRAWLSENALHTALSDHLWRNGIDYDFIEFLLRHGFAARIEERNDENLTPLLIACNARDDLGRHEVVRLLLSFGADTENQGPCPPRTSFSGPFPNGGAGAVEWATPALWAARKGQFRLAKLLLDHGADLNTKSSVMRVTMLHAVCSAKNDQAVTQDRIHFLDYLLAKSTRNDLDTFDATGCTPLTMLIIWSFRAADQARISVMESKLCTKGANMMAGIELGKVTPFETLIQESLSARMACRGWSGVTPSDVGNKVLAAMRVFRINQHPHRPTAFLNQFWGYMDRAVRAAQPSVFVRTPAVISCVLHGLIKAGFHPAEVDRHGDTAMTSFLRLLLNKPILAVCDDENPSGTNGWLIQSIMALLQENGAALHVRNKEGYTAFGYLKKILKYDGDSLAHILLAKVVGHQVQPGQDEHGNMCFKFHPNKHLLGSLGGGSTLQTIHQNPSRWLGVSDYSMDHIVF